MEITKDIKYIGVNDHKIDLFEGQYKVPNGMSYNSYVILDEKIVVMDTVDQNFSDEWLNNLKNVLGDKKPDYLVVQHMEPDHSANIKVFMDTYKDAYIVSSDKAFKMMDNFFGTHFEGRQIIVKEGDTLPLGKHTLHFVGAPMVHWPEVIVTYDDYDKVLFSADGFGKFGALDVKEEWKNEARRYYIGIVGKYGKQVLNLLEKAKTLDISKILPLHGPILDENLGYYINLYNTWATYDYEEDGIVIAYTSVYGHTKKAAELLVDNLKKYNAKNIKIFDLARDDMSEAVSYAFAWNKVVLATTTYNADVYPFMKEFINHLTERNFQNKTLALIENGSWAPMANKVMERMLENSKNLNIIAKATINSALNDTSKEQIEEIAKTLCVDYVAKESNELDPTALFKIGYGLYVVTTNDGKKDNGLIVNTVSQITSNPNKIMVAINKSNYSCEIVKETKKLNINCLDVNTPFSLIQHFGFQSGRDVNKFETFNDAERNENGLIYLTKHINAYISLEVVDYSDLGSHLMFICDVKDAKVLNNNDSLTYDYYQKHVKPKPETDKKGWVCKICGYIYEGEDLPDDFICPLCKHGASDFEKIK